LKTWKQKPSVAAKVVRSVLGGEQPGRLPISGFRNAGSMAGRADDAANAKYRQAKGF
jgi:hypothetical protein